MKNTLCCLLLTISLLLVTTTTVGAEPEGVPSAPPSLSAASAVLTDNEGLVLAEKDAHRRMGPASTTKIMTALLVLERCDPATRVTIPEEAVGIEGSSLYLCAGEVLTVEQLLYGLLLSSANDVATALALFVSGSVEDFAACMNERVAAMGLQNTHFENPHGLADENHYTSAYDLAQITATALRHPLFCKIVSTYKTTLPQNGGEGTRVIVNHNKMLRFYDGAIGVKTGYTKATGRTLVSAAERDGLRLIAVTLDASDDWNDHRALLDYGFARYECVTLCRVGEPLTVLPVSGGLEEYVALTPTRNLSLTLPKSRKREPIRTVEATWHFLCAPVSEHDVVGSAVFRYAEHTYEIPLCTAASVARYVPPKKSPWERLLHFFSLDSSP